MRVDLCGSCELRVLYTNRGITRNSQSCTHLGPKSQHASIAAHRSLKVYASASGLWNSKTYHAISVGDLERLSPKNDFTDDESHSRQLGALLDGCSTGLVILQRHLSENGSCTCRVSHLTTPKHARKFSLLGSPVCGKHYRCIWHPKSRPSRRGTSPASDSAMAQCHKSNAREVNKSIQPLRNTRDTRLQAACARRDDSQVAEDVAGSM